VEDVTATLRGWAATLSQDDFIARAGGPFLVIGQIPNEEDPFAFDTRSNRIARMLSGDVMANASRIIALRKADRSPYSALISVGRARNCDVVLRVSTVSKLHAQFIVEDGWQLVDRESVNSTEVNGERLRPHEPVPLNPGDRIKFGAIECLFANAALLFRALVPKQR
jgi:hypothetical protein